MLSYTAECKAANNTCYFCILRDKAVQYEINTGNFLAVLCSAPHAQPTNYMELRSPCFIKPYATCFYGNTLVTGSNCCLHFFVCIAAGCGCFHPGGVSDLFHVWVVHKHGLYTVFIQIQVHAPNSPPLLKLLAHTKWVKLIIFVLRMYGSVNCPGICIYSVL